MNLAGPPFPTRRATLWREGVLVFSLFTLLGALYTYPVVRYLGTGIPYVRFPAPGAELKWMEPGDGLQLYYWFWLMKDNLTGGSPLFTNPYEFAVTPVLPPQRYGFYQFPLSLLFVLLSPLGGAVAYNASVILSFPLAGLATYLLVRLYTSRRGAALVAALIFALAPFRLGQLLGGHSNGFLFFFAPLILYCYERGLRGHGFTFGLLAGFCLVSLALTDFHLLYYLILLSAGFWIIRTLEALDLPWREGSLAVVPEVVRVPRSVILPLTIAAVTGGVLGLVLLRRGVGMGLVALAAGGGLVAVAAGWLLSAVIHLRSVSMSPSRALARAAVGLTPLFLLAFYGLQWFVEIRQLGQILLALALAGVGLFQLPGILEVVRRRRERVRQILPVLLPVVAAVILAVGYVLVLRATVMRGSYTATGGRPYSLIARNAPAVWDLVARRAADERAVYVGVLPGLLGVLGLARGRHGGASRATLLFYGAVFVLALLLSLGPSLDAILPLYRLLYTYLPYFNYPRSPARLMIVTYAALAVLVGYALRRVPAGKSWGRFTLCALGVGIGLEYAPFGPVGITLLDSGNPLYQTVGREAGDGRFLAIPLFPGDSHQSSVYEFYVTTTRTSMVNGYNPLVSRQYVEQIFDRLVNLNLGEIRQAEYDLLKALRVTFLLVHEDLFFWKVSPFPGLLTVANLRASPYLTYRGRAGDLTLFALREAPGAAATGGSATSPVGSVHELEEFPRRTGREVADPEASSGHAVIAQEGRDGPGYVASGLAPFYPSGAYVAGFRLKLEDRTPADGVAIIDVSTERGRQVLARRELAAADFKERGAFEDFDLQWTLDVPRRVEFRVYYAGKGRLSADRVHVTFLDQRAPAPFYEAEELLRQTGEVRADSEASAGAAVYAPPGRPASYATFGPYRRYPAGQYEAVFRLKADQAGEGVGEVAVIDVGADRGRRLFAARSVTGASLAPPGRYHEVPLPFAVDRPSVLEFRVLHRGGVGLWVDRITVAPVGSRR